MTSSLEYSDQTSVWWARQSRYEDWAVRGDVQTPATGVDFDETASDGVACWSYPLAL